MVRWVVGSILHGGARCSSVVRAFARIDHIVYVCVSVCVCIYVCVCMYVCVYMYVCMYVCMCVCMYIGMYFTSQTN